MTEFDDSYFGLAQGFNFAAFWNDLEFDHEDDLVHFLIGSEFDHALYVKIARPRIRHIYDWCD